MILVKQFFPCKQDKRAEITLMKFYKLIRFLRLICRKLPQIRDIMLSNYQTEANTFGKMIRDN